MKTLFLLRHADAAHSNSHEDKARPLSETGKAQINKLAGIIRMQPELQPGIILCSSAVRTRQTAAPLLEVFSGTNIEYMDELYLAPAGTLYDTFKSTKESHKAAMLVGHNPGIHAFARFLMGEGEPHIREKIQMGYQPCWLSVFFCPCEKWEDLMPGTNRLEMLIDTDAPQNLQ